MLGKKVSPVKLKFIMGTIKTMDTECKDEFFTWPGQPSRVHALDMVCRSQSLQIDTLKPSFRTVSTDSVYLDDSMLSQGKLRCLEAGSNPCTAAQQLPNMIPRPNTSKEMGETKPRIGKEEVDTLKREFKRNAKPTTQTKRQFAEDMGVDLARVNVCQCEPIWRPYLS